MLRSPSHLLVLCARMHRGLLAEPLQALGLSPGEELVLAELWREDGLTQTELGRRLALRRSTVTSVLRTMERRELVRRRPDDSDGRVIRVHHTPRAAALRDDMEAAWRTAEDRLLADLGAEDRAALRRILAVARRGPAG